MGYTRTSIYYTYYLEWVPLKIDRKKFIFYCSGPSPIDKRSISKCSQTEILHRMCVVKIFVPLDNLNTIHCWISKWRWQKRIPLCPFPQKRIIFPLWIIFTYECVKLRFKCLHCVWTSMPHLPSPISNVQCHLFH